MASFRKNVIQLLNSQPGLQCCPSAACIPEEMTRLSQELERFGLRALAVIQKTAFPKWLPLALAHAPVRAAPLVFGLGNLNLTGKMSGQHRQVLMGLP